MRPIFRYAIVGVTTSCIGIVLYALVTWIGVPSKPAATLLYITGATLGFIGNRQWTFSFKGGMASSALRYIIAHTLGYGLDILLLTVFVDHFGYSHLLVQSLAIFIVGGVLFLLFRYFVFPERKSLPQGAV